MRSICKKRLLTNKQKNAFRKNVTCVMSLFWQDSIQTVMLFVYEMNVVYCQAFLCVTFWVLVADSLYAVSIMHRML